jgi:tetratricopeptide (TPR) repeat protein
MQISTRLALALGITLCEFTSAASAQSIGDTSVVIRAVTMQPIAGKVYPLSAGTTVTILKVEDQSLFVASNKHGRIEKSSVIPLAEALPHFTKLIERNPNDAVALFARGKLRFTQGQLDEAMADFDASLKIDPRNSEALTLRGFSWKRKGDKQRAMADFDRAIEVDPQNFLAWRVRGATWASKGDYEKAIAHYTESLRIDPDNPESLVHRCVLRAACDVDRIRDGKQAVIDGTRACELTEWQSSPILAVLATAYAEAGNFDAAVKWQSRAIELASPASRANLESRLELYRKRQPYRYSWIKPD